MYFQTKSDLVHELRRFALGLAQSLSPGESRGRAATASVDAAADAELRHGGVVRASGGRIVGPPESPAGIVAAGRRSRRDAIGCGCAMSICSNGRHGSIADEIFVNCARQRWTCHSDLG